MIIDERIIKDGITPGILATLIRKQECDAWRYKRLNDYYIGQHDILGRKKKSSGAANNKVVCNHAKYIVDIAQAYIVGNPVKYAASEEYDISLIDNAYLEQNIAGVDSELAKMMGIFGNAYELLYANADGQPRSAPVSPVQAFVAYNDDCTHFPLFGVYYYKTHDINGAITGTVCNVYDDTMIRTYEAASDSWEAMQLTFEAPHYFGAVPLIEHINNTERQGDFEQQISLIDAYNKLQSDRVNDKEQFVNSFLFISNMDVDSENAEKLKEERILLGFADSDAKFLSDVMTESDIKVLRDDYKEDIHRFSMVPDLSDESFGNNLSGVAIKYKLLGFEQMIKNKERYFTEGLKSRFEMYNHFLAIRKNMQKIPIHRVDIIFTHNLPVNNLETAQMLSQLDNMLSLETKLSQLDFVSDAKEEAELVRKEKEENTRLFNEYRNPIEVNTYDEGNEE